MGGKPNDFNRYRVFADHGGPLACTNVQCDCDEYVSRECPRYLGQAKAGECPGVFGEHLDGCPDVTP